LVQHFDLNINDIQCYLRYTINKLRVIIADGDRVDQNVKEGTSAGPSGISADVLKDLSKITGSKVAETLSTFAEKFLNDGSNYGRSFITASRLIGFQKGSDDIRPIPVGETLRRFVCKWALVLVDGEIRDVFSEVQFGVADPRGAEKVIHAVREYYHSMPENKGIWKADIGNAFNSIERGSLLSELNGNFKKIYRWVAVLYTDESNLYFHDPILLSKTGVQQGDPMGPFLFGLGINKAVKHINSFDVDLNKWYLDDGVMAGDTVPPPSTKTSSKKHQARCHQAPRNHQSPPIITIQNQIPAIFVL